MTNDRFDDGMGDSSETNDRRLGPDRRTFLKSVGAGLAGASMVGAGGVDTASASPSEILALVPPGDATHVATSSGAWSNAGTWDAGVPNGGARVHVPAGTTVTIDGTTDRLRWVRVDGTLRFDTGADTHLQVDTLVTTEGSSYEMGTASDPVSSSVTAQVTFTDDGPIDEGWDPMRHSRGFLPMGAVEIVGAETTAHETLASHPTAGESQLELDAAPTNWQPGDSLVVPGVSPRENQDEEVTVAGVSGSTVAIEESLQYDHVPPASDLDTYVLNLERNVRFESESTDVDRRGHAMIMSVGSTIEYAGFYEMGRTDKSIPFSDPPYNTDEVRSDGVFDLAPNDNRRARYPLHYHKTGPRRSLDPHEATGCVIAPHLDGTGWKGSPGWGFTNHQSYAHVRDSITYKVYGAGFMTETGVEIGSFDNNFALRSEGSGEDPDWREFIAWADHANRPLVDDLGHNGVGFWLEGPLVDVTDNVAAGQRNFGFAYWNRALGDYVPDEVTDPATAPSELDRDLVEADVGRHRGTIPNVPAEYADKKPAEDTDVAPGSPGPSVDQFAHVTHEGTDGRVYVDEGSIPIRNVGNTALACGSGMDVMNHMRGVGSQMEGETDYYGVVKDFTAYNIGARDGESDLPFFELNLDGEVNFEFPRGVNIGLVMRYASHLKVENPRLVGMGEGVGIVHNMRAEGMAVENPTIENWGSGIGALTDGLMEVRNPTFGDIEHAEINIRGEQILAGQPTTKLWGVDSGDEIYMNPTGDVDTDWQREYWLDDRRVYFERAAPADAVDDPRLTGGLIEPGSGSDVTAPTTPSNLASPSNTDTAVDLDWDPATDSGTGVDHYAVAVGGTVDHTVPAGSTSTTVSALSPETTYEFTVTAVDGAGNESLPSDGVAVTTNAGGGTDQSPYNGPHGLPGSVSAADYDRGGEGVAYHDTTSGNAGGAYRSDDVDIETTSDDSGSHNVGWITAGEWWEYTVQVEAAGTYDLAVRVASNSGGGDFHVAVDGTAVTGTVSFDATGGWQSWTTVEAGSVDLTAGEHVIRVAAETGGWNLNWFEFAGSGSGGGSSAPVEPGTYRLTPVHSGKAVDVSAWSTADGGNVHQWAWTGGDNQLWAVAQNTDGTYRIESVHSGKVLEVEGGSTADGANVQQWAWTGADHQRWTVEHVSGDQYRIVNVASGKALDVGGGSDAHGANLRQWTAADVDHQTFRLE